VLVQILLGVYAALVGLVVGSYLNVVVYRLPRGLSTVRPRSRCPGCGTPIRVRDNVPVLSWLLLGGRCRDCKTAISWRYPAIEATVGLLFAGCALRFGLSVAALAGAVFAALCVALAAIDAEHMILPDRLTLPGIAVGLALQAWRTAPDWQAGLWEGAVGALLGGGLLLGVIALWWLVRREEGMGLGDVKMLALVGAFLGWKGVLVTLFFASLSGAVVGLTLILVARLRGGDRGAGLKTRLPFGTFLALGGLLALFAGAPLADAYLAQLKP
jgi:leader peptidase (prepilin peptidase)/N-methyltransferase